LGCSAVVASFSPVLLAAIAAKSVKKRESHHPAQTYSHSKQFCHHLYSEILTKILIGNIRDAITEEMRFALDAELPEFTTDG